jgi:hypothetical protein
MLTAFLSAFIKISDLEHWGMFPEAQFLGTNLGTVCPFWVTETGECTIYKHSRAEIRPCNDQPKSYILSCHNPLKIQSYHIGLGAWDYVKRHVCFLTLKLSLRMF